MYFSKKFNSNAFNNSIYENKKLKKIINNFHFTIKFFISKKIKFFFIIKINSITFQL